MRPDVTRQSQLNLTGFNLGESVLFCPKCPWQAEQPCGVAPICPDCGTRLNITRVSQELVDLCKRRL